MKSIASIAAVVALAGTAIGQVDYTQPVQTGEPSQIVQLQAAKVTRDFVAPASTKAGLNGNTYSVTHAVGDDFAFQVMGDSLNSVFNSAGQASPFPLNFVGISGSRNIFYNDGAAAWAATAVVPQIVIDSTDLLDGFDGLLQMDSDVETIPGQHEIVIRSWFNSNGASVRPFAQPSDVGFPQYTPTITGVNDVIPDGERHPTGLGFEMGDSFGTGLTPPAGQVWDVSNPPIVTAFTFLGFRNIDGRFVGVNFGVVPTASINANGELVVEFLGITPLDLELNPDTFFGDLSFGLGPIAWGDGILDSMLVYALQVGVTAFATSGATPCPGDIADVFGSLGADGEVEFGDFLALLGLIGPCPGGTPGCDGDIADVFGSLGADGEVEFGDFLALLGLIGPCP